MCTLTNTSRIFTEFPDVNKTHFVCEINQIKNRVEIHLKKVTSVSAIKKVKITFKFLLCTFLRKAYYIITLVYR